MMKNIYETEEYRDIISKEYKLKKYYNSMESFIALYGKLKNQDARDLLTPDNKAILFTRIASSAYSSIYYENRSAEENQYSTSVFYSYFNKYLEVLPQVVDNSENFRGDSSESRARLEEYLILSIRNNTIDEDELLKIVNILTFEQYPEWTTAKIYNSIFKVINSLRIGEIIDSDEVNNIILTLAKFNLKFSEKHKEKLKKQRAYIMFVISDIYNIIGNELYEDEVIKWLDAAIKEDPENKLAKKRLHQFKQKQIISEQIRRFEHDTGNLIGGVVNKIKELNLIAENNNYNDDEFISNLTLLKNEIIHLDGIKKFVRREQPLWKVINIWETIETISKSYQKNIKFIFKSNTEKSQFEVESDEDYFRLAITNIFKNSGEAFIRNRIIGNWQISINLNRYEHYIEIFIEDNAGGIKSELRESIFDMYVSSKGINKNTGLGLSQVKNALEFIEGTIDLCKGQPENGTCFVITLNNESEE